MIAENIARVQEKIANACKRSGRRPESVRLVAVSKTFDADLIREAAECGITDFGENYVQEFRRKYSDLAEEAFRWHFIGHLQTNKVKYIVDSVHLLHSLDDVRLAREIQKRARNPLDVLVEVHTTDEATKTGVAPDAALNLIREVATFDKVRIKGLMTMGPFSDNPNDSRPSFRIVRQLSAAVAAEGIPNVNMETLSMGMTHDFEVAIEEGATMVRIGTGIFGRRETR